MSDPKLKMRWVTPEEGEIGILMAPYGGPGTVMKNMRAVKLQYQQERDGEWYDVEVQE